MSPGLLEQLVLGAFLGFLGSVIWWLVPPAPRDPQEILKRFVAGAVAGFLWVVLFGTFPLASDTSFDVVHAGELVVVGFMGLASLAQFIPKHLDHRTVQDLAKAVGLSPPTPPQR
jgi:hypothetical protein